MIGLRNKHVAIVGRAGSLIGAGYGSAIDAADVVVRINWLLPLDPNAAADIGTRTDILYHAWNADEIAETAMVYGVATQRNDIRLRMALSRVAGKKKKQYQPNSGTVAVFKALESHAARVLIYGMDFYATGYHDGESVPDQGRGPGVVWRHRPSIDDRLIRELIAKDQRVQLFTGNRR